MLLICWHWSRCGFFSWKLKNNNKMTWVRRGVKVHPAPTSDHGNRYFPVLLQLSAKNSTLKEGRKVQHARLLPVVLAWSGAWLSRVAQSWGCCWPASSPASHLSAYMDTVTQGIALISSIIFNYPLERESSNEHLLEGRMQHSSNVHQCHRAEGLYESKEQLCTCLHPHLCPYKCIHSVGLGDRTVPSTRYP